MIRLLLFLTLFFIGMAADTEKAIDAYERWDFATAQKLFREEAEKGDPLAQFYLGLLYFTGEGGEKNLAKAAKWFKKSYAHDVGRVRERKFEGISAEYDRALYWLTRLAERGNLHAQFYLGVMYATGRDVGLDYGRSAKWFAKAAEGGHVSAQMNLGLCYLYGVGIERDVEKGIRWLKKAAAKGSAKAAYELGIFLLERQPAGAEAKEALAWIRKSAAAGYPAAYMTLASLYCTGRGVAKDLRACARWANKASKAGLKEEAKRLWRRYELGRYAP